MRHLARSRERDQRTLFAEFRNLKPLTRGVCRQLQTFRERTKHRNALVIQLERKLRVRAVDTALVGHATSGAGFIGAGLLRVLRRIARIIVRRPRRPTATRTSRGRSASGAIRCGAIRIAVLVRRLRGHRRLRRGGRLVRGGARINSRRNVIRTEPTSTCRGQRILQRATAGHGQERIIRIRFHHHVISHLATIACQSHHVALGHGIGRPLRHKALSQRSHGKDHHNRRQNSHRSSRHALELQQAANLLLLDLLLLRTRLRPGIADIGQVAHQHAPDQHSQGNDQHHRGSLNARHLNGLIPPRNSVAGDVPPAVRAGQSQCEEHEGSADKQDTVASRRKREMGSSHRGQSHQRSTHAGVHTKVVRPPRRREHHEEHRAHDHQHQAAGRPLRRTWHLAVAQRGGDNHTEGEQQHQDGEAAGERAIHCWL